MIDFEIYLQSSYSFNGSLIDIEKAVEKQPLLVLKPLDLRISITCMALLSFIERVLKTVLNPYWD